MTEEVEVEETKPIEEQAAEWQRYAILLYTICDNILDHVPDDFQVGGDAVVYSKDELRTRIQDIRFGKDNIEEMSDVPPTAENLREGRA